MLVFLTRVLAVAPVVQAEHGNGAKEFDAVNST